MYKFIDSMHQDYEDYYGYVYLTLDQKYNKVYVGQKKGFIWKTQNYYGSGSIISIKQKSRGTYFLKKRILGVCYSKEELTESETECKHFFNSLNPIYGYNIVEVDSNPRDAISNHPNKLEIYKKRIETRMSWYTHSEETKWKLHLSHLGMTHTEETKIIIREKGQGRDAWNKGLTKETNDSVKKISNTRIGIVFSQEHVDNIKVSLKKLWDSGAILGMTNKHHREESKQKMSIAKKGKPIYKLRGRLISEETKYKCGNGNRGRKQSNEEKEKRVKANTKINSYSDLCKLIDLYFEGKTTSDIATHFNVNPATIRKKLKILNLPLFNKPKSKEKYKWLASNLKETFYNKIHDYE